MPISGPSTRNALRLLAGVVLVAHSGCMSALTTASLRDVLLDTVDSLAEATALDATAGTDVSTSVALDEVADEDSLISEPPKPFSLDEAVERAVARLNGVGQLDPATQATLLSILENTNPQDWPAAIDAFTASLEAHRPPQPIAAPTPPPAAPPPVAPALVMAAVAAEPEPHEALVFPATVATHQATPATAEFIEPAPAPSTDASLAFPVAQAEPERIAFVEAARPVGPEQVVSFGPPSPAAVAPGVGAAPVAAADLLASETPSGSEPGDASPAVHGFPATPAFAVCNACFVTRVRAWGAVDRFPEAAFRPGQDVIVYFEIDAPRPVSRQPGIPRASTHAFDSSRPTAARSGSGTSSRSKRPVTPRAATTSPATSSACPRPPPPARAGWTSWSPIVSPAPRPRPISTSRSADRFGKRTALRPRQPTAAAAA